MPLCSKEIKGHTFRRQNIFLKTGHFALWKRLHFPSTLGVANGVGNALKPGLCYEIPERANFFFNKTKNNSHQKKKISWISGTLLLYFLERKTKS